MFNKVFLLEIWECSITTAWCMLNRFKKKKKNMSAFVRSTKATQYKDGRNDLYEKVIHIVLLSCYVLQQHRVYLLLEWNQNECGVKNMPTTASSRWKVGWTFFFTIKGIYKDRKKLEKRQKCRCTLKKATLSTHSDPTTVKHFYSLWMTMTSPCYKKGDNGRI